MLNRSHMLKAFTALGDQLGPGRSIEILIVGGAAGMLTGELSGSWTTADVDLMDCHLPKDREEVLNAAHQIRALAQVPTDWLNELSGLFAWSLPSGWKERRTLVGEFGRLHVYAVGRLDLMTMKFAAHRSRDAGHLQSMNVTADELTAVILELTKLRRRFRQHRSTIDMALAIAKSWSTSK